MLIRPIITEKSLSLAAKNRFTFEVKSSARKPEIRQKIEKAFEVDVTKISTITVPGKQYRTGKKWVFGNQPNGKKAIVTLKKGQKIDLFEIGNDKEGGGKGKT
jgi:large subunit ribosomal protein L23